MSLLSNIADVSFYSNHPADKVVRQYKGTFRTADLIARPGSLATAYVVRIPHDVGRPMMCELLTSTNGGTSYNAGVGQVAFSDSNYVYIFTGLSSTVSDTLYKIYCSWIDDYDNTNPSIQSISYISEPVQFDSRLNYQKIHKQGVLSYTPGTFGTTQTQSVGHTLGYEPNVKVFFEAFTGEVWPMNIGGVRNPLLYDGSQDEASAEIYSDRVDIKLFKFSNATKRAWYKIYYDAD